MATEASASGKLAPQRMAAGSIAHNERTRSSWKVNHGLLDVDGSIGQYGSDCVSMYADQAMAPASSICTQASARRGRAMLRDSAEPTLLPMPRPKRNTARISEKV